jgi:acetylornithine deacetylase
VPGETAADAEREVRDLLAAAAGEPDFEGSVQVTFARDAFEVDEQEQIVVTVRASAAEILGREPAVVGHSAWMDSSVLAGAGIPTVVIGPGDHGAHAAVEWAELGELEQAVAVLVRTIEQFCGGGEQAGETAR